MRLGRYFVHLFGERARAAEEREGSVPPPLVVGNRGEGKSVLCPFFREGAKGRIGVLRLWKKGAHWLFWEEKSQECAFERRSPPPAACSGRKKVESAPLRGAHSSHRLLAALEEKKKNKDRECVSERYSLLLAGCSERTYLP
jgi:hypothetical protein